jgi:hypothetical protein
VNVYRQDPCEFCEKPTSAVCRRCACNVCEEHGAEGHAFCRMCQKEYKDEKDIETFARDVAVESADDMESTFGVLIAAIYRRFVAPRQKEARMPPFSKRTPADIAAWRRTAGVRTRR